MKVAHYCPKCGVLPLPILETEAKIIVKGVLFSPYEYLLKQQKSKCKQCKSEIQYIPAEEIKRLKKAGTFNEWLSLVDMEKRLENITQNDVIQILHDFTDFVENKE